MTAAPASPHLSRPAGLLARLMTVSGWTMVSRVFGFLRDIILAATLGASAAADAFFVAFKLPNFFRRLFAEGAFSAGFVPAFSKKLEADGRAEAARFAAAVLAWFLPILALVLLAAEALMLPIMLGLTGGFAGDVQKLLLTVELGRITFPYLAVISLVSLYAGMLQADGRFAAAAAAPILLNVCMIGALLLLGVDGPSKARALAAAVSVSGALQLALLWGAAKRAGFGLWLAKPALNREVKSLLAVIGPAAIGAGIIQLNLLIDIILAARLLSEGAISWLFYGDRLIQLPLGVIGVALGTVLLPALARALAGDRHSEARRLTNQALLVGLGLGLPAAAACFLSGHLLIAGLFERGNFDTGDTAATASALRAYAVGLPAYILAKGLLPSFHARGDTRTPVMVAVVAVLVNLLLNLLLIGPFGHIGLALATSVSAWVILLLYAVGLWRRRQLSFVPGFSGKAAGLVAATALMGAALWVATPGLGPLVAAGSALRAAGLVALVCGGLAVYALGLFIFGTVRPADVAALLRRGSPAGRP